MVGLDGLAPAGQALVQAVQAPHVVGMPARPAQLAVEAQVGPVDGLGLVEAALLHQQRPEGVAGGLHPAPRLVVGQVVVELDRPTEVLEGGVEVAPAVLDLAGHHGLGHGQDVEAGVVEQHPALGHPVPGGQERLPLLLGLGHPPGGGVGHRPGVAHHGGGDAVELGVVRQGPVEDLVPLAEADQHVLVDRHEALQPVGQRRVVGAEEPGRQGLHHLGGGLGGRAVLAQEHRPVRLEVVVVAAVQGVEVRRALVLQVPAVGDDRGVVAGHHVLVVAAQHVDVGGHVDQVPGVGDQVDQRVAGLQGPLGMGRHLHQVDVHVQQAGMAAGAAGVEVGEGGLEDLDGLDGAGAFGRFAGHQVPQRPRGAVHDGLGEQRAHVEVVSVGPVDGPHGVGVGVVPRREVVGAPGSAGAGREAPGQCADQGLLHVADAGAGRVRRLGRRRNGGQGNVDRLAQVVVVEVLPGIVVVGADGVGDAPVGHGAAGVVLQCPLEAGDGLVVVEAVAPRHPPVEPQLGLRIPGGDRPTERPQVVVAVVGPVVARHLSLPAGRAACGPKGTTSAASGPQSWDGSSVKGTTSAWGVSMSPSGSMKRQ